MGDADAVLRLLRVTRMRCCASCGPLKPALPAFIDGRPFEGRGPLAREGRGGEGRWRRRRSGCGRQREEVAMEEVVATVEWIWDVGRGEKERVGALAVE